MAIPRMATPAIAAALMLLGLHIPKLAQEIPLTLILQVARAKVVSDQNRPLSMNPIEGK